MKLRRRKTLDRANPDSPAISTEYQLKTGRITNNWSSRSAMRSWKCANYRAAMRSASILPMSAPASWSNGLSWKSDAVPSLVLSFVGKGKTEQCGFILRGPKNIKDFILDEFGLRET